MTKVNYTIPFDPARHDPELHAQLKELCRPRMCDAVELKRVEEEGAKLISKMVDNHIMRNLLDSVEQNKE